MITAEKIQVRKNVPLPGPARTAKKYPFDQMLVGDSFTIKTDYQSAQEVASSLRCCARRSCPDRKFTTRVVDDDHDSYVTAWRIA